MSKAKHANATKEVKDYLGPLMDKPDGIYIRPVAAYAERQLWKKDPARKRIWGRNLNTLYVKDIKFRLQIFANIVIGLFGDPGVGKSTAGKSTAHIEVDIFKKLFKVQGKIHIAFEPDEFLRILSKAREGDCVVFDEVKKQTGEDSRTVAEAINNTLENFRAARISVVIISPNLKNYFKHCLVIFKCFGWLKKGEATRNILIFYENLEKARKEQALGHVTLKRLTTPELEEDYKKKKQANLERVKKQKGLSFVQINKEEIFHYADLGLKRFLDTYAERIPLENLTKAFLISFLKMEMLPISQRMLNHVIERAWFLLQEQKLLKNGATVPVQTSQIPEPPKLIYKPDKNFVKHVQEFISQEAGNYRTRIEYLNAHRCAILYPYFLDIDAFGNRRKSMGTIKEDTELPQHPRTLHRHMTALREFLMHPNVSRKIGHLFEDYFAQRAKAQGKQVKQEGGDSGGIDALILNEATDFWEPYTLKCYHREREKSIRLKISDFSQTELKQAEKIGLLHIVLMNPCWNECPEQSQTLTYSELQKRKSVVFRRQV